ncbi:helix-turn-helix domain-containing protein [Streptomyces olivoreticuli]
MARLGAAIRCLRESKGWSQAELGQAVSMSNTAISKFETGGNFPVRQVAEALDRALDAKGKLFESWDQLNDDPTAKWVEKYFAHESKAIEIHHLAHSLPALLQCDEYIRAILQIGMPHYGGNLDEKVAYRQRRRAILDRPDPPSFRAVIAQSALDYIVGDATIMRAQLLYMLDTLTRANVELRVHPLVVNGPYRDLGMTQIMAFKGGRRIVYRAGPTEEGVYVTNPMTVAQYSALYDQIWRQALPSHESITVIRKALEEKYPCAPFDLTCP